MGNSILGGLVGRGNRAFRSEKRTKELKRLKKQEEKRQRRQGKGENPEGEPEVFSPDEAPAAPPELLEDTEQKDP
jgi:hypothetical protein